MPRVTSILRPVKKSEAKPVNPDLPLNPAKPIKLEPNGLSDAMDFSKICSASKTNREDLDIPDREICD